LDGGCVFDDVLATNGFVSTRWHCIGQQHEAWIEFAKDNHKRRITSHCFAMAALQNHSEFYVVVGLYQAQKFESILRPDVFDCICTVPMALNWLDGLLWPSVETLGYKIESSLRLYAYVQTKKVLLFLSDLGGVHLFAKNKRSITKDTKKAQSAQRFFYKSFKNTKDFAPQKRLNAQRLSYSLICKK
jgi:hypothetical protein